MPLWAVGRAAWRRSKASRAISLSHFAEYVVFLFVHALPLAPQPQRALRGVVEGDAGRIARADRKLHSAGHVHDDAALLSISEADVVGGIAQPLRPVLAVWVAVRGGFPVPENGLLTVLRDTHAELKSAAELKLAFAPTLHRAGLVKFRREIPVFWVSVMSCFVGNSQLNLRFRLPLCRGALVPRHCRRCAARYAVALVVHQREPELRHGVSGLSRLRHYFRCRRMIASLETLASLVIEVSPGELIAVLLGLGAVHHLHRIGSRGNPEALLQDPGSHDDFDIPRP